MWPAKDKGAINTRASARDKFGSWCASSHATGQSPSTITGVPVVREADVITALKLLRGMGVGYGRCNIHLLHMWFCFKYIYDTLIVYLSHRILYKTVTLNFTFYMKNLNKKKLPCQTQKFTK